MRYYKYNNLTIQQFLKMRIIGEINHPTLKITVFKNEGKCSVKFEAGLLEQIYKFRDDERLQTFEDIQRLVDESFIQKVEEILRGMLDARLDMLERNLSKLGEDEFDKIL
jgi:hypothetical protein